MSKTINIEKRTEQFIDALLQMKKANKSISNVELARELAIKSVSTISEIKAKRQNIQPEAWKIFQQNYSEFISEKPVSQGTKVEEPTVHYHSQRTEDYIQSLKDQIDLLKEQNEFLKEKLLANLEIADSDRLLLMGQLRALNILEAERFAAGKKKIYDDQIARYRKLVVSADSTEI